MCFVKNKFDRQLFFFSDSNEEITTAGKEEKKNIEAKEIENIKRIEKIINKTINMNKKLKKIIKDTEDKKNKEYEKRQSKYKKYMFLHRKVQT